MLDKDYILKKLDFDMDIDIISIFPYGSKVYGTYTDKSDDDFIIVSKQSILPSGSFRDNAISSVDMSIQAVLYSRSGFIDSINNYYLPALECLSLSPDKIIFNKWKFSISKWNNYDLIKNIIKQSSASWHIAELQSKNDRKIRSKKGIFHALRILDFGIQLKEHKKIINFSSCNDLYNEIQNINDDDFDDRNFIELRDNLTKKLKGI